MICPRCHSGRCRRSKRRGARDFLIGISGLRPWRCKICDSRFYAWAVPVVYAMYTHCPLCGNLDLQRISGEHVHEGWFAWLFRLLRVPAYRCVPCRYGIFSLRPCRRIVPVDSESARK